MVGGVFVDIGAMGSGMLPLLKLSGGSMANILVAAAPALELFFGDQAVALGFRFVPLSGKADINYTRMDEELPERADVEAGP